MEQLLLFEKPVTEMDYVWEAIEKINVSHDKTRKRLFSEVKELQARLIKLKAENERLKIHSELKPTTTWVHTGTFARGSQGSGRDQGQSCFQSSFQ